MRFAAVFITITAAVSGCPSADEDEAKRLDEEIRLMRLVCADLEKPPAPADPNEALQRGRDQIRCNQQLNKLREKRDALR
jgi:hypothetical protein